MAATRARVGFSRAARISWQGQLSREACHFSSAEGKSADHSTVVRNYRLDKEEQLEVCMSSSILNQGSSAKPRHTRPAQTQKQDAPLLCLSTQAHG